MFSYKLLQLSTDAQSCIFRLSKERSSVRNFLIFRGIRRKTCFDEFLCRARKWAELAGRKDLMDKKLENLTKYYLCSDHFASDAFVNPETDDKSFLRLNRLYSIPLPTIFEDNLMKNVESVTQHPEKFVNYTKHSIVELPISLTTGFGNADKDQDVNQNQAIKTECYEEYIEEELETTRAEIGDTIDMNAFCRLCARNSCDLVPIFDEKGELYLETKCLRLMPSGLIRQDDELPQYSCVECLEKLQSCANIIDSFVLNQSLFSLQ